MKEPVNASPEEICVTCGEPRSAHLGEAEACPNSFAFVRVSAEDLEAKAANSPTDDE